jgi:hypothetical protein
VRKKNGDINDARDLLSILNVIENRGSENRHEYYVVPGTEVSADGTIKSVPTGPAKNLFGDTGEASSDEERTDK